MIPQTLFDIIRFPSREVKIGDRPLGGLNPIRLQSMTNTPASDIESTVNQCIRIIEAGSDYVRVSTPNMSSAHELASVKKRLRSAGFSNPLVADIHFNAEVALIAARHVEKIRINPGNYTGSVSRQKTSFGDQEIEEILEKTRNKLKPLIEVCKENGTAIRIGTNMGSLSSRMIATYGNTPDAMVASTLEFLDIFRSLDFHDLVISLKTSKPITMIQAYEGMVEKMLELDMNYPLHVGITEAGEGENGRIKSALGICTLLNKGIGDTVRVSLTEKPEDEIPFAKKLTSVYQIPFAEKREKGSYNLQKLAISNHELFPLGDKRRAVVIDELDAQNIAKETDHAGIQFHDLKKRDIAKIQPNEPDIYFIRNAAEVSANPDKYFLLSTDDPSGIENGQIIVLKNNFDNHPQQSGKNAGTWLKTSCPLDDSMLIHLKQNKPGTLLIDLNGCDTMQRLENVVRFTNEEKIPAVLKKVIHTSDADELICNIAILAGQYLLEKKIHGLWIKSPSLKDKTTEICYGFLQSAGVRITKTEFISCPTCARTSYDLEKVLKDVRKHTSEIPGLKIAVMGCVVNGPGEMADADFGFVGTGNGKVHLYKGKNPIIRNILPNDAARVLKKVLSENGYL